MINPHPRLSIPCQSRVIPRTVHTPDQVPANGQQNSLQIHLHVPRQVVHVVPDDHRIFHGHINILLDLLRTNLLRLLLTTLLLPHDDPHGIKHRLVPRGLSFGLLLLPGEEVVGEREGDVSWTGELHAGFEFVVRDCEAHGEGQGAEPDPKVIVVSLTLHGGCPLGEWVVMN